MTRRKFLAATVAGAALAAAGGPRMARAQAKTITVAHSVSTFVYGQHLVAREKKFFDTRASGSPISACPAAARA
jgi:ABC-type nitrate/sulfonate/bicarbonate transport system substrate-binding protein